VLLQLLNLVQALRILHQLAEGVLAVAAWGRLHLLTNLQGRQGSSSVAGQRPAGNPQA
jgi:hypothetical protein